MWGTGHGVDPTSRDKLSQVPQCSLAQSVLWQQQSRQDNLGWQLYLGPPEEPEVDSSFWFIFRLCSLVFSTALTQTKEAFFFFPLLHEPHSGVFPAAKSSPSLTITVFPAAQSSVYSFFAVWSTCRSKTQRPPQNPAAQMQQESSSSYTVLCRGWKSPEDARIC